MRFPARLLMVCLLCIFSTAAVMFIPGYIAESVLRIHHEYVGAVYLVLLFVGPIWGWASGLLGGLWATTAPDARARDRALVVVLLTITVTPVLGALVVLGAARTGSGALQVAAGVAVLGAVVVILVRLLDKVVRAARVRGKEALIIALIALGVVISTAVWLWAVHL